MKKHFSKFLSVFLVAVMLFSVTPAFAFAGAAETADTPVFQLTKIKETPEELVVALELGSGSFVCFDATVTTKNNLICTNTAFTADFSAKADQLGKEGLACIKTSNPLTGKVSVAATGKITAPVKIIEFTFAKAKAAGIVNSDLVPVIDSCYIAGAEGTEVEVAASVLNMLSAKHEHVTGDTWTVIKPATCKEAGIKVQYCSECGEIVNRQNIEKLPHKTETITVAPTCTENGKETVKCTICGEIISEKVLPATGHADTRTEHKDATCTEAGYDRVICADCGKILSETIIPATGHVNTRTEHKDATCTEDGYDRVICEDCNAIISETVIPATNHAETRSEHKDPTCTEAGYDRVICADCGKVLSETVIPATGHVNTRTEHKDPTCTEAGYNRVICADCGKLLSETIIPATGHVHTHEETTEATCTEPGYVKVVCDECGEVIETTVYEEALGHLYVTEIKKETCTEWGYIITKCARCDDPDTYTKKDIPPHHDWSDWIVLREATYRSDGLRYKRCKECGETIEEVIPMIKVPVEDLKLSMNEITINYKQKNRLYVNVLPEDAAFSAEITWKSSNPKVVTVDENGNIAGTHVGEAVITASTADGTIMDTCKVKVTYSFFQWLIVIFLFGWIWY